MDIWRFNRFKAGFVLLILVIFGLLPAVATASPFGQGVFGADVPFGSATSITVNLGSNVGISLTPSGGNLSGVGSQTINVTSTDVVGYLIYIRASSSTNMVGASTGATIPASSNTSPASLSASSWGYNASGSTTNFMGITLINAVIKSANGPFKSGDNTTVKFGVLTAPSQAADSYSANVTYTVVAKNE